MKIISTLIIILLTTAQALADVQCYPAPDADNTGTTNILVATDTCSDVDYWHSTTAPPTCLAAGQPQLNGMSWFHVNLERVLGTPPNEYTQWYCQSRYVTMELRCASGDVTAGFKPTRWWGETSGGSQSAQASAAVAKGLDPDAWCHGGTYSLPSPSTCAIYGCQTSGPDAGCFTDGATKHKKVGTICYKYKAGIPNH